MMLTYDQILERALAMPEKDRRWLAEQLLISVKPPGVMSIEDPEAMGEIVRRSDAIHAGTTEPIPGDIVAKNLEEIVSRHYTGRDGVGE